MIPLAFLQAGDEATVVRAKGTEGVKKHLEDLGFVPGAVVSLISQTGKGNIIVSCKGTRLALTSQMAGKIEVVND